MQIEKYYEPFPYIIIDDYYEKDELSLIWEELEFLTHPQKLRRATKESGGAQKDGKLLKQNYHRYLDHLYEDRNMSNILSVNRKLFDQDIFKTNESWFFQNVTNTINMDFTQVGYYENNDEYGLHHDHSVVTSLTWLYKEPKKFTGGDLYIGDSEIKIECVNNRTLVFPSMIKHKVNTIHMEEEHLNQRLGRYCISQFALTSIYKP